MIKLVPILLLAISISSFAKPVAKPVIKFVDVSTDEASICAKTAQGQLYCKGDVAEGVHGRVPAAGTTFDQIAVVGSYDFCANQSGKLICSHWNDGLGKITFYTNKLQSLGKIKNLWAKRFRVAVLYENGFIGYADRSFGTNAGPLDIEKHPSSLRRGEKVAWTAKTACGIKTDKTVDCWGVQGTVPDFSDLKNVTDVSGGVNELCVATEGKVICATGRYRYEISIPGVASIASAEVYDLFDPWDRHCALDAEGKVTCWEPGPRKIYSPSFKFTKLSGGQAWICGLSSGNVYCTNPKNNGVFAPVKMPGT